jgi:predicted Zn-dependent protease
VNAFALPGGIIVVHTGLIDAARRPEHVEQRHSLEAVIRELGLRGLWAAVTGDFGSTIAGKAAMQLASLRFSRDAEREADVQGFETLLRHDIDPRGMADFFGTLAERGGAAPPAWLSTHPPSEARQRELRERARQVDDRAFAPLEPALWAAARPAATGPE